ncbi:MAG: DUF3108 domain-containing protein [Candidatus Mcinerneyibacterium aminivorans]|uniref:DUF3108 domain-containing protein n=1 Tax=Candidatus Mcinerneyibacterium aminivorans TaxID=2703815 RepID=A0A5D0MGG2_9BACT|nr:MAG: DUF3108 domain-containing protein [Candidatus Mcinerneyibacterium aminivorans]
MKNKIVIFIFILILLISPLFSISYNYKVKSMGITVAKAQFTERIDDKKIYLTTKTKSKKVFSIFKKVNNEYYTIIDKETFYPLFQEKNLTGNRKYYNYFYQGKNIFLSEAGMLHFKEKYITNLFALFYYIKKNKPKYYFEIPSISCNTLWKIKVFYNGTHTIDFNNQKIETLEYILKFKALEKFEKMKNRYKDMFLKEAYWNSSVIKLYIDRNKNILYKSILESFDPNLVLILEG